MDAEVNAAVSLLKSLGWTVEPPGPERWGCHLELFSMPDGAEPDGCVIDEGDRSGCIYASDIQRKEQCRYWKRITPDSISRARNGDDA